MKSFRTLDLAIEFYRLTKDVPLPAHLKEQMNRAASSISLNLAEGNGKFSFKDKARIYQIANGSLRECQTILKLAEIQNAELEAVSKHLGSSMYRLVEAMIAKSQGQPENR